MALIATVCDVSTACVEFTYQQMEHDGPPPTDRLTLVVVILALAVFVAVGADMTRRR